MVDEVSAIPAPAKGDQEETMTTMIDVPARGRRWVRGAVVRDGMTLYRVTGAPIRYHEDCLPVQPVARVRQIPEDWRDVVRLMEIMDTVRAGTHTPGSRGAGPEAAEPPATEGEAVRWEARQDAQSYASYPSLEVRGDVLCYVQPVYDDAPIVTWLRDPALADEARALIARRPSLTRYPRVRVRSR